MTRQPLWIYFIFVLLLAGAGYTWLAVSTESMHQPPGKTGDDIFLDNLAFEFTEGRSFKFDFTKEKWLEDYQKSDRYDWIRSIPLKGRTSSRAPGYPFVLSKIYRTFGRNWQIVRLFNVAFLALGIGWLLYEIACQFGLRASLIAAATISIDFGIMQMPADIMSDSLGTGLLCGALVLALRSVDPFNEHQDLTWFGSGILFGLTALVRSQVVLWIPVVVVGVILLCIIYMRREYHLFSVVKSIFVFLFGLVIILGPWGIRNCKLTREFLPMGTAGGIGMPGGYSDACYDQWGNWAVEPVVASQRATRQEQPDFDKRHLGKQEAMMHFRGLQSARDWVSSNQSRLPVLMIGKGWHHLGFSGQRPWFLNLANFALLAVAAYGCYVTRSSYGVTVLILVSASVVTTALTWSHFGRYFLPLRPAVHVAAALGIASFLNILRRSPYDERR